MTVTTTGGESMSAGSVVFLIVALGIIGWIIAMYNGIVTVRNNVRKSWKNIDVVLQQRNDELPKLIDTCKAYLAHESALLTKITELRTGYAAAKEVADKINIENELSKHLAKLHTVWEQYPDLKAVQSFLQIQDRVSALESKIADSREAFNDSVNTYNIQIERFPDLLMAGWLNCRRHAFLEVPEEKKEDVKMSFS
jgi:LemA protein